MDRQAVPVGEIVLQEGLVRPPPENPRPVQMRHHRLKGAGVGTRGEHARVHAVEPVQPVIDIGCGAELRQVEQLFHRAQHHGIGVDEDAAVIIKLPQPQLDEVVQRRVEIGLAALGKGRARVQRIAGMGAVEAVRRGQQVSRDQPGAMRAQPRQMGGTQTPVHHHQIGPRACQLQRPQQRLGPRQIVGIGHKRDIGPVGPGRRFGVQAIRQGIVPALRRGGIKRGNPVSVHGRSWEVRNVGNGGRCDDMAFL